MATLSEIKQRIASVRSTLKITSAMKRIAAAKLHRAQQAIQGMRPYEAKLQEMLAALESLPTAVPAEGSCVSVDSDSHPAVALVLFSSNSSLCGSFNANVAKGFRNVMDELHASGVTADAVHIYAVGRKAADAVRKSGYTVVKDYSTLADHPDYAHATLLTDDLLQAYARGEVHTLLLVYNHYASNASQPTRVERVPFPSQQSEGVAVIDSYADSGGECSISIVEPSRDEVLAALQPRVFRLKLFTTLLDANAAEHAARTVAMQIASDNAERLLDELTLAYNKSRQQKITSEILDLVGGQSR